MLKEAGIKRTAYNIIGLPNQTEDSIIKTLEFNHKIKPDTSIAAFYSIYRGTKLEQKADKEFLDEDPYGMDPQIRSKSFANIPMEILQFYKDNFTYFVKNGLSEIEKRKNYFYQINMTLIPYGRQYIDKADILSVKNLYL